MKKLLSTPFAKEEIVVSEPEIRESAETLTAVPNIDELGRLRDILFGSQSRTIEKRISDLETGLQAARRELAETFTDKLEAASNSAAGQLSETRTEFGRKLETQGTDQTTQLRAAQKELSDRLERQNNDQTAQLRALQKELSDGLEKLETDFVRQLRAAQKELSDQIEKMGSEQAERLRNLQAEARQRDDGLRQELLNMTAALENKKTSRQDLGQMLVELGLRLRRDADTPSA
jgi:DNA repair exonuclease SbcCD ATPase subunit